MSLKVVILISGSGSNMAVIVRESLQGRLSGRVDVRAVISNRADAAGLGKAASAGIPAHCVPSKGRSREDFETELSRVIDAYNPELVVLAGFMRVLTPLFIGRYQGRIINIHPADTAEYQGPHGYEWAWDEFTSGRRKDSAITVHYVDTGLDTGPVIRKERFSMEGLTSLDEFKSRGLAVEHRLYSEVLFDMARSGPAFPAKGE